MPVDLTKPEPAIDVVKLQDAMKTISRLLGHTLAGLRARSAFGFALLDNEPACRMNLELLDTEMLGKVIEASVLLGANAKYVLDGRSADADA